jgi:hypothetical protein
MLMNQVINRQVTVRKTLSDFTEINRLLAAAVVSSQFCNLLLTDPARAIEEGFAGERFNLSDDEQDFIFALYAPSLKEFASRLCEHLPRNYGPAESTLSENPNEDAWLM